MGENKNNQKKIQIKVALRCEIKLKRRGWGECSLKSKIIAETIES